MTGEAAPVLRYGVLLSSTVLPRWQVNVLDHLDRVDGVELVVVVVDAGTHRSPTAKELWKRKRLAWTVYNRIAARGSSALTPVDCSERFAQVTRIDTVPMPPTGWQQFDDETLDTIRAAQPDMLLRLGFNLLTGDVLDVAPLGVWSFHHGDERVQRGGPPCFWELVVDDAETGVLLQRLTDRLDGGIPLARASFPTQSHSYGRNRQQAYLGGAPLVAQAAARYLSGDHEFVDGPTSPSDAPVRRPPSGRVLAALLPRQLVRFARREWKGLIHVDQWRVGLVDEPIETFVTDRVVADVDWFPTGASRTSYYADPFGVVREDGSGDVLVEEYDHRSRHGVVSVFGVPPHGVPVNRPTPTFRFGVHASYPYTFEVPVGESGRSTWWCVPELGVGPEVVAVDLSEQPPATDDRRATDRQPIDLRDGMAGVHVLVPERLVDPTVFRWRDRWWLLGTDPVEGPNTYLRGWWADQPSGPWTRHSIDPLVISASEARSAGTPFVADGRLFRPAQVCVRRYGEAIAVMEVTALSPHEFAQRRVATLRPDPNGPHPDGLHTLSFFGDRTLVDGVSSIPSAVRLVHELTARVRRG